MQSHERGNHQNGTAGSSVHEFPEIGIAAKQPARWMPHADAGRTRACTYLGEGESWVAVPDFHHVSIIEVAWASDVGVEIINKCVADDAVVCRQRIGPGTPRIAHGSDPHFGRPRVAVR